MLLQALECYKLHVMCQDLQITGCMLHVTVVFVFVVSQMDLVQDRLFRDMWSCAPLMAWLLCCAFLFLRSLSPSDDILPTARETTGW